MSTQVAWYEWKLSQDGMEAVFAEFARAILRVRVRAGMVQARTEAPPHGWPRWTSSQSTEALRLKSERESHSEIARRLGIGRSFSRRILAAG